MTDAHANRAEIRNSQAFRGSGLTRDCERRDTRTSPLPQDCRLMRFDRPAAPCGARPAGRAACFAVPVLASLPVTAWPHAFGERYDLPAPLAYFVAGAAATVALSFVVAALAARGVSRTPPPTGLIVRLGPLLPVLRVFCPAAAVVLLVLTVTAGLFGTRNPEMNLAPTLVWIIGWVGLSLVAACFGNVWPALDPWRAIFEAADGLARRCGAKHGISPGWPYPRALAVWPAAALLLVFTWIEVVYLRSSEPSRIACMLLTWSALTLSGMVCFGRAAWQRDADVFAIYFAILGRFAPIGAGPDPRSLVLRPWGRGLIAADAGSTAMVAFVIVMLSTVLFDGLLGGLVYSFARQTLLLWVPDRVDDSGYFVGTLGLLTVPLLFYAAYLLTCFITARLVRGGNAAAIARLFALTLVPIVIAYLIAHNLSNLLIQGQLMGRLVSDPLGRGWDLFGTAEYYPDIGIIDARMTWYIAIGAIVVGHVISIWLAHRLALREFGAAGRAVIASIPLTTLMVIYTAVSLAVIAEPLVQFRPSDARSASGGAVEASARP